MDNVQYLKVGDKFEESVLTEIAEESGFMVGQIIDAIPRKVSPKDGRPDFTMVDIYVKGNSGARFRKTFSVDFARKFLNFFELKIDKIFGLYVFFKQKDEYKNIGKMSFISCFKKEDGTIEDIEECEYINDKPDRSKEWKDLGLL